MLKKLLYLYNDGHNPFPKLGKGGLGYHLPNHKLVGNGLKFDSTGNLIFVPDPKMTSEQAARANTQLWEGERQLPSNINTNDDTKGFQFFEDDEIDAKNTRETDKIYLINELLNQGATEEQIQKTFYTNVDKDKVERNEYNFEKNLFKKGRMIIQDLESKLIDHKYTEHEKDKMIKAQYNIAINNEDKLIRLSKQNYMDKNGSKNSAGKGLEEFLQTYGQSIIRTITSDKSNVKSNDDNPLNPYDGLKQYATIDLYNNKFVIECKEYTNVSKDSDKVVLQDTKLCGDHNYNLVFNSEGKIIKFQVKNPKNKKEIKDILQPVQGGRDYIVIYRLDDGLYEYNVSESIKKYIQKEAKKAKVPLNEIEYEFNYQDIKTGQLGSSMYEDGRRITDSFGQPCFIVKKKYLKKIEKKIDI